MRLQLEQVKQRHKAELEILDKKSSSTKYELETKENARRQEFIEEEKKYVEQRQRFEIQKKDLEEKLKNLKSVSQEQTREKEKELLSLQNELAEKEKQLEDSWKEKEKELEHEKALLVEELELVNNRLNEEEQIEAKKVAEKTAEIERYQQQYAARMKNMEDDANHKKAVMEEANAKMQYQVHSLSSNLNEMLSSFNEAISAKEKDYSRCSDQILSSGN